MAALQLTQLAEGRSGVCSSPENSPSMSGATSPTKTGFGHPVFLPVPRDASAAWCWLFQFSPLIANKGTIVLVRERATCGRTVYGKTQALCQLNPAQPPDLPGYFKGKCCCFTSGISLKIPSAQRLEQAATAFPVQEDGWKDFV